MGKIIKNKISYAGGGSEGKSAYQTWLDLGNTGTEQDFLDSLGGSASIDDNNVSLDSTWSSEKTVTEMLNQYDRYVRIKGKSGYRFSNINMLLSDLDNVYKNRIPYEIGNGWEITEVETNGWLPSEILPLITDNPDNYFSSIINVGCYGGNYKESQVSVNTYNNETPFEVIFAGNLTKPVVVDEELDIESTNAIQNKAVAKALATKGATYTSLEELGLTADVTLNDVIATMSKGSSALLAVTEFTNAQTMFPYEEGNDYTFGRVYIVKGNDTGRTYAKWFRKDGAKEYIAKMDISTNAMVGWKPIFTNYYTSLVELGLTAPTTVGEVFVAMPNKSMLMLNVEALADDGNVQTVTDVPKDYGILTIEKHSSGRHRIEYSSSLGGSSSDVCKWIGSIKGNDGTGLRWIELTGSAKVYTTMAQLGLDGATATVQDVIDTIRVGEIAMLRTDAFNNDNWKTQCNNIQYGYLKIEKTMNGLSNIELQEVVAPNRRYFGTQASGKFAGWIQATNTTGLVSNSQNFKINLTKNNAAWYGFFTFSFMYGVTPCEITISITTDVYYTITKGQNLVSAITYTQDGANYTIGIDLTAKVYGTQVVDIPSEFGVVNSLTAETFAGATSAIFKVYNTDPYACTGYTALTGTEDLFTLPCGHYVSANINTTYNYPITDTNTTAHIYVLGCLNDPANNKGYRIILYFDNKGRAYRINEWWGVFTDNGWQEIATQTITSLSQLGLTASATLDDVVTKLKVGQSATLTTMDFTNYQTIFPYSEEQDAYATVRIEKGYDMNGSRTIVEWVRKDASKIAYGGLGSNNKVSWWNEYATKSYVDSKHKYSTNEVAIGTWIDGSTIYRTVVEFNSVEAKTSESEVQVATNIPVATPQKVIRMEGFVNLIGNQFYIHYPNITCNDDTIKATVNIANGNVKLKGTWKYPIGKGALILEYTK